MDRCVSVVALLFLAGCYCVPSPENSNNVMDYFEGCYDSAMGKPRAIPSDDVVNKNI